MFEVVNRKTGKRLGRTYATESLANNAVLAEILMYVQAGVRAPFTVFDFELVKREA
ncbi:MAG: hypothetical protein LUD50_03210 [Clostridia bacterium]|nr:hypothetical protein [Clostridia bacterium]